MTRGPYRTRPIPGSFAELIAIFRTQSPRYRGWSRATRKHADRVLDDFRMENGKRQASELRFEDIVRMRDSMSDVPGAANNWLKVISALMRYAKRIGYVDVDPMATKLESLPPLRPGGHRTWRDDELAAYRAHWPVGSLPRLVFEIAAGTGASGVDLVKLGWPNVVWDVCDSQHVRQASNMVGRIRYRRQKTERRKGTEETPLVDIVILPELAEVLALVPRDRVTFLETEWHLPRSQGSLVHKFRAWVAEAGLGAADRNGRHLTLHGLRKALGRRLAERGASPHVIMAILGHESIASAQVYTRAYDRAQAADKGAELLAETKPTNVTGIRRRE